jgi:hypothetical protein
MVRAARAVRAARVARVARAAADAANAAEVTAEGAARAEGRRVRDDTHRIAAPLAAPLVAPLVAPLSASPPVAPPLAEDREEVAPPAHLRAGRLSSPGARTLAEPWVMATAAAVAVEATTCTTMHACKSALLARSGRRGSGLCDRTNTEKTRKMVVAKRERDLRRPARKGLRRTAQGAVPRRRGNKAVCMNHDHEQNDL